MFSLLAVNEQRLQLQTGIGASVGRLFHNSGYVIENGAVPLALRVGVVFNTMLMLLGVVFLMITVYSGIQWMMAGGNEENIEKAKTRIVRATIGVAIILGSWIITQFVLNAAFGPVHGRGGTVQFQINLIPAAQAQIPNSPIQPGLRDEIIGVARSAAAVGLGDRALTFLDARAYAMQLVRGALGFVGLIFIALLVYAGFLWMTASGSEEKIEKAKGILVQSTIAVAVIMMSYGIAVFVQRRIVRLTFENMITQVQSCSTQNGQATCCQEWNSFQSATTRVPGVCQGASTWSQCGDAWGQAYNEQCLPFQGWSATGGRGSLPQQCGGREYDAWKSCVDRERSQIESAFGF